MCHPVTAAWITQMLIDKGIVSEGGLTRKARIQTHRPCRMPCLAAIDDLGLDTWCDLAELTPQGELDSLLEGRHTWHLHAGTDLCHRGRMRIAWSSAGDRSLPVFAEHRCDQPIGRERSMPAEPPAPVRQEKPW